LSTSSPSFEEIKVSTEDQVPSQILNVRLVERSLHNLTLQWSRPALPKYKPLEYEVWAIPLVDDVLMSQETKIEKASIFIFVF